MILEEKPEKNHSADWWADRCSRLLDEQKSSWPLLGSNFERLERVQTRKFSFDNFTVIVQYNPDRIISSSADVSDESIKSRRCFLCTENLPPEQKGLSYDKQFVILSNPYPIFKEHFTVSRKNHTAQSIVGNFAEFLEISRAISSKYTLFYNGPKCGSSAPDHMHFQAVTKNIMPAEYEYDKMVSGFSKAVINNGKIQVRFFEQHLRHFISFESKDKGELLYAFKKFINSFKKISPPQNEPLMNLILSHNNGSWRLLIFPRQKHRPIQYYLENTGQILISPAAVDMGGIFITPRKEDFEKITEEVIVDIYRQVTLTKEYFEFLRKKIGEIFI